MKSKIRFPIINKTLHQFQDFLENDRLDEVLIPVYEDRAVILYQLPESHSRR